jgi:hypothetical protein
LVARRGQAFNMGCIEIESPNRHALLIHTSSQPSLGIFITSNTGTKSQLLDDCEIWGYGIWDMGYGIRGRKKKTNSNESGKKGNVVAKVGSYCFVVSWDGQNAEGGV